MRTFSAADAKNRFGELLDAAQRGPVRIEKHGRGTAVLLSEAEYAEFEAMRLQDLHRILQQSEADIRKGKTISFDEVAARMNTAFRSRED